MEGLRVTVSSEITANNVDRNATLNVGISDDVTLAEPVSTIESVQMPETHLGSLLRLPTSKRIAHRGTTTNETNERQNAELIEPPPLPHEFVTFDDLDMISDAQQRPKSNVCHFRHNCNDCSMF